jgi:hypothetical protein
VIEAKGANGRVTFDGVLVTIHRGGARAWLRGTGIRSIPAWAITAVELKPAGFGRGWISFEVDRGEDGELDDDDSDDDGDDDGDEDGDDEAGDDDGVRGLIGLGGVLGRSRRSGRADRAADGFDPAKDPDTVMFTRGRQREFEDIRREVKAAMWEAGQADDDEDLTPTRPLPAHDPVRELRQLGQLLQDGVLSRAEFERAKARLLDRI